MSLFERLHQLPSDELASVAHHLQGNLNFRLQQGALVETQDYRDWLSSLMHFSMIQTPLVEFIEAVEPRLSQVKVNWLSANECEIHALMAAQPVVLKLVVHGNQAIMVTGQNNA